MLPWVVSLTKLLRDVAELRAARDAAVLAFSTRGLHRGMHRPSVALCCPECFTIRVATVKDSTDFAGEHARPDCPGRPFVYAVEGRLDFPALLRRERRRQRVDSPPRRSSVVRSAS